MRINIPPPAQSAVVRLEKAGFEAYAVGGCVRDSLLGKTPQDWDVTTDARPEKLREVFSDLRCIDTGLRHGTLTVLIDGEAVEITSFRIDGEYRDHRRPDSVEFTGSLSDDLARRDFTVNAMAYSDRVGVVDLFGGRADLERGIIRCVGEADRRFDEDALRILRGLRFASALDFEVESETSRSIISNRALLKSVCAQRISKELLGLLCGPGVRRVLRDFAPVLFEIMPELEPMYKNGHDNPHHCLDIYEHTLLSVESVRPDAQLRMAMLLHDCGKPAAKTFTQDSKAHFHGHQEVSAQLSAVILNRLELPNKFRDEVLFLVANHDRWELYERPQGMRKYLARFGPDRLLSLLEVMRADVLAQSAQYSYRLEEIESARLLALELADSEPCLGRGDLAVNGRELIDAGIPQGRELGRVLDGLLGEVLDGELPNEREELIRRALELCAAQGSR